MAVTCGWTLDEQGRAMSKSLGNGVDPVDIAHRLGAEIVRLWVASVDFREDMAASENLMQRVAENYRKLRNTFRYLLGTSTVSSRQRDAVAVGAVAASRPLHADAHARAHGESFAGMRTLNSIASTTRSMNLPRPI